MARPWERLRWPDEPDDEWYDLPAERGQERFDGEVELDAREDADWYEDMEHNGLAPARPDWRVPW